MRQMMSYLQKTPTVGAIAYFGIALVLGAYFTFAAVQGTYGLFQRVEIEAEAYALRSERDILLAEVARTKNLTHRLSDEYLDLDLLDERSRDVLGMTRADEIVIR